MRNCLIVVMFMMIWQVTCAQEFSHEAGICSKEEFLLEACPFEPSAEAVVLYDIGKSYCYMSESGSQVIFERRFKVKLFKRARLDVAQITIPLYHDRDGVEVLMDLTAQTYNQVDGMVKTTSLNTKQVYTEKLNDRWDVKKFALPDVKEGSIFEVSYKVISPYIFNLHDWEFQREIPVMYSEYTTSINSNFEFLYYVQGTTMFDDFKKYKDQVSNSNILLSNSFDDNSVYYFVKKNVPAFKNDEYISSDADYKMKINFQLSAYLTGGGTGIIVKVMTTWPELSKELLQHENFGRYVKSSQRKAAEIVASLDFIGTTDTDKARSIRKWVSSNFNSNGFNSKYASKSVKDFLNEKTGNVADINLLFIALLREAGIDAHPLIISTRDNGKLQIDYPLIGAFNYVLAVATIDGKQVILDATESLYDLYEIPPRCLNQQGFIVRDNEQGLSAIHSQVISSKAYKFGLTPLPLLDSLQLNCKVIASGYEAANLRSSYIKTYDYLIKGLVHDNYDLNDSLKQDNLLNIGTPFELSFKEDLPLESLEGKIIIDPFSDHAITENPFKQVSREYPVDLTYRKSIAYETIINIPDGYKVLSKPEDFGMNNTIARIVYVTDDKVPGKLRVTALYEFKKDIYPAAEYDKLKVYMNMIVSKFNEKIILSPVTL